MHVVRLQDEADEVFGKELDSAEELLGGVDGRRHRR